VLADTETELPPTLALPDALAPPELAFTEADAQAFPMQPLSLAPHANA
jgi:hypothetical protein